MDKLAFIEEAYNRGFNEELEKLSGISGGIRGVIAPMFKKYQQHPGLNIPGAALKTEQIVSQNLRPNRLSIEKLNNAWRTNPNYGR